MFREAFQKTIESVSMHIRASRKGGLVPQSTVHAKKIT